MKNITNKTYELTYEKYNKHNVRKIYYRLFGADFLQPTYT